MWLLQGTRKVPEVIPDLEAETGGEGAEDEDVRRERRRVATLLQQPAHNMPPLVVHVSIV